MASMRKGWFSATARRRASFVALYTANTSLPSTRIDMMPYPGPRAAAGTERVPVRPRRRMKCALLTASCALAVSAPRKGSRKEGGWDQALTYAIPTVLLRGWCGNGIAIVPAEEDDRTLQGGSKVETGMGIPFTGCPLTKVTDHNPVSIGPFGSIGCSHRCMGTWMTRV